MARQVLLPDMDYYDADYIHGQLSVKYLFPLKLKGYRCMFYVKAYGGLIYVDWPSHDSSDDLTSKFSLGRKTVGITFGLYN